MQPELKPYASLAYSNEDTIQNTHDLALRAVRNNIEGDFVECGVAAGAQIGVMGYICQATGSNKKIYAYDSYRGIPLAGPNDTDQPGVGPLDPNRPVPGDLRELLKSSGVTSHSLESVKYNIGTRWRLDMSRYHFIEGWFQDTLPFNNIDKISLLRLDGDLYESTKVCLEYLHPKVQKGGFVIVDDYALAGARKALHEYWDEHKLNYELIPVRPQDKEVHWYQIK